MNELAILNVRGVRARLDEKGNPELNLEDVSRGLGFTQNKNGVEYIRWETINGYLHEFGFSQQVGKETFIKENIFYKLCFKARNEIALKFQDKVTDEILPEIRKTGSYSLVPKTFSEALRAYANEVEQSAKLKEENETLEIALNTSLKFYTVAKYNKEFKMNWNMKRCQKIGKKLTAYCIANCIEIRKCQTNDERFGETNSYPLTAWESFLNRNCLLGEYAV